MPISCLSERLSSGSLFRCRQRRGNLRFNINIPILVGTAGRPWTVGETINLSASGVYFIASRPLLKGVGVEYVLTFPRDLTDAHQPSHVRFSGTVVRNEPVAKPRGNFGIAVRNETLSRVAAREE